MNITLRQLRAFVTVAETGKFTLAAELLGVSQSSLSLLVRDLENLLGLRLFDRHTRRLELTDAGHDLLPVAQKTLMDLLSVVENSRDLLALKKGRVTIAAGSLHAATVIPDLLKSFNRRYPGIRVIVEDVAERQVRELIVAGTVDVGIGMTLDGDNSMLAQVIGRDKYAVLMHKEHQLMRKKTITWQDIAATQPILLKPPSLIRTYLDQHLARVGITLTPAYEVALPWTMTGMVRAGVGVAIVTTGVLPVAERMGLELRTISAPVIERELAVLTRAGYPLSPAAQSLRTHLLEELPQAVAGYR
ncbi:transcriptional regulator, LysR family [Janthinobacterium sp. Marseille]|nr:LysR family transcriptional regulator [Janthinobacterium sp. Marseille]ABR90979.1 transcriptional regulator, LysR family [Janthinobacterium sp. Marseille]